MTMHGAILGTVAYMSPEQARGLAVDKRTDIWAFGCVLFEMLAGRAAFAGSTASDSIAAILGTRAGLFGASTRHAARRDAPRCAGASRKTPGGGCAISAMSISALEADAVVWQSSHGGERG